MSRQLPDIQKEFIFRTSRSGGAGGQHVNKVESRVEARWSVQESRLLNEEERNRLIDKLKHRISGEGILSVSASDSRAQSENKQLAAKRLQALIEKALVIPKKRKKTALPRSVKEKRLSDKKFASEKKANRRNTLG